MRHWLLGSSIATILVLGTQLAGAQAPAQSQGAGATSQSQGGAPGTSPSAEQRSGRQGQEPAPQASGLERRSSQQDTRGEVGGRDVRRDEQSQGMQDRRSRMGEEDRGDDRRYRSDRDEGGRRFDEGRRQEEGRRFDEGRRYGERGDRFDERRRTGDRYEDRRYEERRYGSRMERGYSGPRNLQITRRQRARVHDIIVGRRVEPAHVDFPIRIGARVPSYVTSYQLPEEIYDYAPGYEGYRYFMANDEIVIVDPETMEVVAVLDD
jgi:Protein of unknown function (DUF1236)